MVYGDILKKNSTKNLQITNDQFSSNEKNFIKIQDLTVNQFPGDGEAIRIQWKSQRAVKSSEVGNMRKVKSPTTSKTIFLCKQFNM